MPEFESIPKRIIAEQFIPDGPDAKPLPFPDQEACKLDYNAKPEPQWYVVTIHGAPCPIESGDWIIPEPDGEHFYPVKPDIFVERYRPISE